MDAVNEMETAATPEESARSIYHESKFLSDRLTALNDHAKTAFQYQLYSSIAAFIVVIVGWVLIYFNRVDLAVVQGLSTVAVSLVTGLFYQQSNKANDDTNKFALISIKFNESWNIIEEALEHCRYILDDEKRYDAVQNIINKQLELSQSQQIWGLTLDDQKKSTTNENNDSA